MTSSKWSATCPMDFLANTSGCSLASWTVSGSSGHPGVREAYPAPSKSLAHLSQLLGSSHRPWTNTTGLLPDAFALSICACSCLVTVVIESLLARAARDRGRLGGGWTLAPGCANAEPAPRRVTQSTLWAHHRGHTLPSRAAGAFSSRHLFRWAERQARDARTATQ